MQKDENHGVKVPGYDTGFLNIANYWLQETHLKAKHTEKLKIKGWKYTYMKNTT